MRALVHTAWATVLLFGTKGNTRALKSGTAIVQSRFYLYKRNTIKDPLFCMHIHLRLSRHSTDPILSRSRSACAPRTPSLFKDKSQLSFPYLASLIWTR